VADIYVYEAIFLPTHPYIFIYIWFYQNSYIPLHKFIFVVIISNKIITNPNPIIKPGMIFQSGMVNPIFSYSEELKKIFPIYDAIDTAFYENGKVFYIKYINCFYGKIKILKSISTFFKVSKLFNELPKWYHFDILAIWLSSNQKFIFNSNDVIINPTTTISYE